MNKAILFIFVCFSIIGRANAGTAEKDGNSTNLEDLITSLFGGDGVQLVTAAQGFNHAPHFQADALFELNELTQNTFDSKLPIPSTSAGLIYHYDATLDDFVPTKDSFGPVYVERANTLGSGNAMFGFNYTNVNWSSYNGQDLNKIMLVLDHVDLRDPGSDICIGGPPGQCYLFEEDNVNLELDIDFSTEAMFLFGAYGITDKWDLGVVIPVIRNKLSVYAQASVDIHPSHQFFSSDLHYFDETGVNGDPSTDFKSGSKTGLGDILLFSKYNMLDEEKHRLALSVIARLDTGDKANLMGFDNYGLKTSLLSSHAIEIAEKPFKFHFNLGYEINAGVLGQDEVSYAAALEQPFEWDDAVLGISYELIGSKDVNENKYHQLDAGISLKYTKNDIGTFSISARTPLNDDGLRANLIYTLGFEFSL